MYSIKGYDRWKTASPPEDEADFDIDLKDFPEFRSVQDALNSIEDTRIGDTCLVSGGGVAISIYTKVEEGKWIS